MGASLTLPNDQVTIRRWTLQKPHTSWQTNVPAPMLCALYGQSKLGPTKHRMREIIEMKPSSGGYIEQLHSNGRQVQQLPAYFIR